MENENSQEVVTTNAVQQSIEIGVNADVSNLSLEQRALLFQRWTEAQAASKIDDSALNKKLHVIAMTPYTREFVDQDTGFTEMAHYVSFTLHDGAQIRTAASGALSFANACAKLLGYDFETGELPHPIYMLIKPVKAEQGFQYQFIFQGLAKA